MDIQTLKNFVTIAENGSILRAANILHISQPPLSKQMQVLEKELGVTLFTRTPRGVKLTEKGEILYKKALSLISYSESILSELQDFSADRIQIGIISSIANYILKFISDYGKENNVTFSIFEKNSFKQIQLLEKGLLDIVIVREPFDISSDIQSIKLFEDKLYIVGNKEYFSMVEGKDEVSFKDFDDVDFIVTNRWYNHLDLYLEKTIKRQIKYVCEDNRTAAFLAAEGAGVSIVPGSVVDVYIDKENQVYKPLGESMMNTDIYLLYNKNVQSNIVEDFVNYITERIALEREKTENLIEEGGY